MEGKEGLCREYEELEDYIARLLTGEGYVDKLGGLTSEGRAFLRKILRFMAEKGLGCVSVVRELYRRLDKVESVYGCIRDYLDYCRRE